MKASPTSSPLSLLLALLAHAGLAHAAGPREVTPAGFAPSQDVVGSVLPAPPDRLDLDAPQVPSLDRVRIYLEAGDPERARVAAERFSATAEPSRARDAADVALGLLFAEDGRRNLACEAFSRVRAGDGPLAPIATHAEAEQEAARGQPARAIERCAEYRQRWPDGLQRADCLRITALAYASLGDIVEARRAADAYDDDHPWGQIGEQVSLHYATRLAETDPGAAAPLLRQLAVAHEAALTGRVAEEALAKLRAAGVADATLPDDPLSQQRRAISLRDSGRRDAAWAAFLAIAERTDAASRAFAEKETERFAWQTHRWDFLASYYAAERQRTGDADSAWSQYKVLARAGRFGEAGDLASSMVPATRGRWRRSEDDVGRTLLLAKRYTEARALFDVAASRGGYSGRRAAFTAAFAAYMGGELADAEARFDRILANDPSHATEALYWRARTRDALGRAEEAAADRAALLLQDPWSWYGALTRQTPVEGGSRAGRWPGARASDAPPLVADAQVPAPLALPSPVPLHTAPVTPGFARWRPGVPVPASVAVPAAPEWIPLDDELGPPPSYRAGALYDPDAARAALAAFAEKYGRRWPELRAVSDLAAAGLYDLSGPMLSEWYEDWRYLVRRRDREARRMNTSIEPETWRALFLGARDHHDAAKFLYGSWEDESDPARAAEAQRLGYPLAHDRYVWSHARERDIDPFLVLGLMRQESTYDATARSRVGARGAMQIMPRTGHLLADLAHDTAFDAGDLEDPTLAVGYAMRYLDLLMERFGGVYPLAVASYNAGPFAVSNWLRGTGAEMPIDEWVEHIPYNETRDYVKKVSDGYVTYVALYGPPGAAVVVPRQPNGDRPEVVDF